MPGAPCLYARNSFYTDSGDAESMGFGTIFFIVVTVIVLYQLWAVLGRRTCLLYTSDAADE